MSRTHIAAAALILLGILGGLVALAVTPRDGSDDEASPSPATAAHDGLCQALQAADAGDEKTARAVFFDRSHDGLHDLAARAAEIDRSLAADLLEAKQDVEALLDGDEYGSDLAAGLSALAAVTASATERIYGADVKDCG